MAPNRISNDIVLKILKIRILGLFMQEELEHVSTPSTSQKERVGPEKFSDLVHIFYNYSH